jgi:hypothetical protein
MKKKKYTKTVNASPAISVCCDAPFEVLKSGKHIIVRCSVCKEYIGNVVSYSIGILETKYENHIAQACRDRGLKVLPNLAEIALWFQDYADKLDKFAAQAARCVVKEHIPIE